MTFSRARAFSRVWYYIAMAPIMALTVTAAFGEAIWRGPSPTSEDLYRVAWGNGALVAAGTSGVIMVSWDKGETWSRRQDPSYVGTFYGVAYGEGTFVCVGSDGGVYYSLDFGTTWSKSVSGVTSCLRDVVYARGKFLAVGDNGTIIRAGKKPKKWQRATTKAENFTDYDLTGVCYGERDSLRYYAIVGHARDNGEQLLLLSNKNGNKWMVSPLEIETSCVDIAYGGGRFVAVGGGNQALIARIDELIWKTAVIPAPNVKYPTLPSTRFYNAIEWTGSQFLVVGPAGGVLKSSNGDIWTDVSPFYEPPTTPSALYSAVSPGNGLAFVAGEKGAVRISTDAGSTWTDISSPAYPFTRDLRYSACGKGKIVSVGDSGTIVVSPDGGGTWTAAATDATANWSAVAFGVGRFVAVGAGGQSIVSDDGETWGQPVSVGVSANLLDVRYFTDYAQGVFVACGANGCLLSSVDGLNWTQRNVVGEAAPGDFRVVLFGFNQFCALDDLQRAWISVDLVKWTSYPTGGRLVPNAGAYGNDRFLVVADDGKAMVSTDGGLNWTAVYTGVTVDLNGISYGDGRFVAVTDAGDNLSAALWTKNGVGWQADSLLTRVAFQRVTYDPYRGAFVACGDSGSVVTLAPDED